MEILKIDILRGLILMRFLETQNHLVRGFKVTNRSFFNERSPQDS
jgi:hypothetical protein